jgi:hypothetical protein
MAGRIRHAVLVGPDNTAMIYGGFDEVFANIQTQIFDGGRDSWTRGADMPDFFGDGYGAVYLSNQDQGEVMQPSSKTGLMLLGPGLDGHFNLDFTFGHPGRGTKRSHCSYTKRRKYQRDARAINQKDLKLG